MKEYLREACYGALWGIVIGLIGIGIFWAIGSAILYLV